MTVPNPTKAPEALISKGMGISAHLGGSAHTIVWRNTPLQTEQTAARHKPNARDRRAARDKLARRQRQAEHFKNATAFAYFNDWPLEIRPTITWAACAYGDQNEGNILGMSDKARNERLRSELARTLRKADYPFACIWGRDEGAKLGLHVHLGLYWPLPDVELAQLLARLTGSPPSLAQLPHDVVAQSECGGWQIKRNTALQRLASAHRWANYLMDQGKRHLIVPQIAGKVLGVSRTIGFAAVEAQKPALEEWKRDVGW